MPASTGRNLRYFQIYSLCFIGVVSMTSLLQSRQTAHKRQIAVWRIECELGIISDPECPVDGGWSTWGPWGACHGPCDEVGHRRRTRQCNNPQPSKDGIPCTGPEEKRETCYITNCTSEDFRKLIEGDPTRTQAYHELEVVPALMERCFQKQCLYDAIQSALSSDNTWQLSPEIVWNALLCVKYNLGCPVTGEWGGWGAWSTCGARCGRGKRWRLRRCDTPPPSNAQLVCNGTPLQTQECEGDQCALKTYDKVQSFGDWSSWSNWSTCSEQCGTGVRRRRRFCIEKPNPHPIGTWGTHCIGQHDELEVCKSSNCKLDGGWSGWSTWGPCSQSCGAGKRYRTRSCTRPIPTGDGQDCTGPKIEVGSCYITPCQTFSHIVVLMNGESFMQYKFDKKRSTLFHFYVRFMPLSPRGTLVRRGTVHNPLVRLSLQKWHICLDASGTSDLCTISRICSPEALESEKWHSALVTVTNEAATIRLDDAVIPIKASFPCDPELSDEKMDLMIGERFHGQIQEMAVNFIPLDMEIERTRRQTYSGFHPTSTYNIAFEKAGIEEVYLHLNDGPYVRLPCFDDNDTWRLELTFRSKRDSGTILFLKDDLSNTWLHMALQNMRLRLKIATRDFHTESVSVSECWPDQWLDVTLSKNRGANIIEVSINDGERLHVTFEEDILRKKRSGNESVSPFLIEKSNYLDLKRSHDMENTIKPNTLSVCSDEFFLGGVPLEVINKYKEEFIPFSGVISSLSINKNLVDLYKYSVERYEDDTLQVSSRSASISGSYHEMFWGNSNQLNLTCVHARSIRSPHAAHWLYLDTAIKGAVKGKTVRAIDDGRLLRLDASANDELRGFYTCRAHNNKHTRNIITYGVIGLLKYDFSQPATTAALAVITTALLVLATLGWLCIECINDIRNGFGFFRDANFTPEQEAEAVCKYIDANVNLIGPTAARLAKTRARLKAQRLNKASKLNFGAQEPEGLMQIRSETIEHLRMLDLDTTTSDLGSLPALPEGVKNAVGSNPKASLTKITHQVYHYEPHYTSSPCHGSYLSPRSRLSSSFEIRSPRYLCNRLLLAKRLNTSRESLWTKRRKSSFNRSFDLARDVGCNLETIKSSAQTCTVKCATSMPSPAQKILQKFQELRTDY